MAYSLQHSRANSNEFEKEADTSGLQLKIKQAAQPRFKLKYYQAQSRQQSPEESTPDIFPTGEEDLTKYQKEKIVSEMTALEELKRKLYGLKRTTKFSGNEEPNL